MNDINEVEFDLKDFFRIINVYKWLIILIIFIFIVASSMYLFFTLPVYSTYSTIEVKTRDKGNRITNDLLQNAFYLGNKELDKEMEILRTYNINKKVIEKIDFRTQLFIEKNYKREELYGDDIPIIINQIKIIDSKILGMMIKISLKENGYLLEIEHSKKDIFISNILKTNLLKLDNKKVYSYGKIIKTDYFELSIKKLKEVNQVIYFKINGDSRNIYESIIQKSLNIEQLTENAPLIKISYKDTIPLRATNYINSLVDIFLQEGEISKSKRNDKILKFLKRQLQNTKKKLDSSEKELEKFKVRSNIINISAQSTTMINKLSDVEIEISENILKKLLIDNILQIIKNRLDFDSIGAVLTKLEDNGIMSQFNSLQKLKLEEINLSSEYTEEYPQLIKVRSQILSIKNSIILNIKNLKSSIQYKISNLEKLKQNYEQYLLDLPKKEINLVNLKRRYEVNSKMYAYLLQKKSENEMIKVATISDYKIIEKAYLPKQSIEPKRSLVMLLSLILGFIVGVLIAIILNKFSSRIKYIGDIERNTKIPLYGVIPFVKKMKNKNIEVFVNPQSDFTESYRKLRMDLRFLCKSNKFNTILVTSTIEKEGKSAIVANLSAVLQLAGYKTIVIDLDLRNPSLHKYFDIDFTGGMSRYLSGKENLSDIIFSTAYPNLDIIPAGSIPTNPSELILSDRVEIMLGKLKERYDYILIDSSSIGSLVDTFSLMKYADINLVVFRLNKTKKLYIKKLENMIAKYNLKNIGLVVNVVDFKNKKDNNI